MAGTVFANGLEVSAKQSDNQSIAAMPDVCLSPPSPPAGPIPIPYPNFSQASDTTDGTKTVKIAGDEVGMKNQSSYKTSKGDEAATKSLGMGVNTASLQGKTYFAAWSSDVMFEGANAVRFTDLTTHNHANPPTSGSTTASTGGPAPPGSPDPECQKLDVRNKEDQKRLPADYAGAGNTNTNFNFDSRSSKVGSLAKKAHSKVAVQQMFPNDYVEGNPASQRLKAENPEGTSNCNCPGTTFRYSAEFFRGGHTEARIVEHLFANNPTGKISGTLTMKINWQPSGGGQSSAPCEHCHAILCAASKCGLEIVFCSDDNRKVPLEEKDCQKDLDMRKDDVRKSMESKNKDLVKRLKRRPKI